MRTLHIRQQTEAFQVARANHIRFINKDQYLAFFLMALHQEAMKAVENFFPRIFRTRLTGELSDNLFHELDERHIGIGHKRQTILRHVQGIDNHTEGHGFAQAHIADDDGKTLVPFFNSKENFANSIFHTGMHIKIHGRIGNVIKRWTGQTPILIVCLLRTHVCFPIPRLR